MNFTDAELRTALEKYEEFLNIPINSSTRPVLLRKLAKIKNKKVLEDTLAYTEELHSLNVSQNDISHEGNLFPLVSGDNIYRYYALALDGVTYSKVNELEKAKQVFKCKSDALQAIKHIPGARCIECGTEESARGFVEKQLQQLKESEAEAASDASVNRPASKEKANSYSNLSTQEMNIFRVIIEKKDLDGFCHAVCDNPYYLITAGDTPAILKPPLRYNALHCAVRSGSLEICEVLLETLQGDDFWSKVYPKDPLEIRKRRRDHLLDLYLNTCDKGFQETPLHFACKFGHEEIIKYLLRFSGMLDIEARNKYDEMAYELVCNDDSSSSEAKKKRIRNLFSAPAIYYVPVLRAHDNSVCPKLSTPCTYPELMAQECEAHQSPHIEATKLSSVAGPMSPLQAKAFYNEWRSPYQSLDLKMGVNVRRTDPDRGLERIGRRLAHRQKVTWTESWDFLNCSCDLSEEEGKKALEQYLTRVPSPALSGVRLEQYDDFGSVMSPLILDIHCQEDSVKSLDANMSASDLDDKEGSTIDKALAECMDSKLSLHPSAFFTPKASKRGFVSRDQVFLTGSEPTKLDYDVMLALEDSEVDSFMFPRITHWLNLVRSYSKEEQKRWTPATAMRGQHGSSMKQQHTPQWQKYSTNGQLYSSPSHPLMTTPTRLFDHPSIKPTKLDLIDF